MTKRDNDRLRLQELETLYENWFQAQQHIELYQARILKAFNKKVKESLPKRKLGLSSQMTHGHDTQYQRKILTQMERAFCSRDNLLK